MPYFYVQESAGITSGWLTTFLVVHFIFVIFYPFLFVIFFLGYQFTTFKPCLFPTSQIRKPSWLMLPSTWSSQTKAYHNKNVHLIRDDTCTHSEEWYSNLLSDFSHSSLSLHQFACNKDTQNLYFEKDTLICLLRTIPSSPLDELSEGQRSVKWNYGCFLSASLQRAFQLSSFLPSCSDLSHQDILLAQFPFLTTLFVKTKGLYPHVPLSGQAEHHQKLETRTYYSTSWNQIYKMF